MSKGKSLEDTIVGGEAVRVGVKVILLYYPCYYYCTVQLIDVAPPYPGSFKRPGGFTASFRPVVFRGLVKCRLLELPPKRVSVKGLGICILTSKPGNSGADTQITTLGL